MVSNKQGVLISRVCVWGGGGGGGNVGKKKKEGGGGWNIRRGPKMVNRESLRLVWLSRHLLHRKMTKEKSKDDIKHNYFLL